MNNFEKKIDEFLAKQHQLSFNGLKYMSVPIIFFIIVLFGGPIMIANYGVSDSTMALALPISVIIGILPWMYSFHVVLKKEQEVNDEINQFIKEFSTLPLKEELTQLYEQRISSINNEAENIPINKIMLVKANEYYKNFLFDIERKVNKDWDYFYAIYKYLYFFNHLKDVESFRKLDEKKFEPVYDSSL